MSLSETVTGGLVTQILSKFAGVILEGKKIPQLVRIIAEPSNYIFSRVKRATTTSNKYDLDSPNIEIENELDRETQVKEISLLGNTLFKSNGIVKVYVDNVVVFDSREVGNFADADQGINVPLINGKRIKQRRSVKVLMKNDDDSSSISLACQVTFGD